MKGMNVTEAIKRALPAVVSIGPRTSDEYVLPTASEQDEMLGGSGFIVESDGIIVTNRHVVGNPQVTYEVILQSGRGYPASVLAHDPATDVAFLRIVKKNLEPIAFGSARGLELGEKVIAIGNVLGRFSNTVSSGIVSGLSRSVAAALDTSGTVEELEGLIQTDAAINPGNSGGPLINLKGEAIGINVATVLGAQNLGFAIPIDTVRRNLNELKRFGRIRQGYLGIRYIPINKEIARTLNFRTPRGALIASDAELPAVAAGSPAHEAGLRENDVILTVNGERINANRSLAAVLAETKIGNPVILSILRGGKRRRITVTPTELQQNGETGG